MHLYCNRVILCLNLLLRFILQSTVAKDGKTVFQCFITALVLVGNVNSVTDSTVKITTSGKLTRLAFPKFDRNLYFISCLVITVFRPDDDLNHDSTGRLL